MENVKEGNTFIINLPDPEYIDMNVSTPQNLVCDNNDIIGTYIIENGKIITTFNKKAEEKYELKNGFFEITGYAIKDGKNISLGTDSEITINIEPGGNGGGGSTGDGTTEIPEEKLNFSKDGKQYMGLNKLNWHVNVNYDQLKNMIEKKDPVQKFNMIFEDTLKDKIELIEDSIKISTPIFVPTPEGKMSGTSIAYLQVEPVEIIKAKDKTYDEFYNKILNIGKPVIGLFEKTILICIGDLPGNNITYADLANGSDKLNELIDNAEKITTEQKEHMKEVYGSNGPSQGQVLAYDISFDTLITGETGTYENTAIIRWNEKDKDESKYEVHFVKSDAGVESVKPGNLRIRKKDNQGNLLSGISFKLQKLNTSGEYEDYAPNGSVIELSTNSEGILEFENLEVGKYRIVETKILEGYGKPKYYPSEYVEINEGDDNGVFVDVVNPKEEKISITGIKTWNDKNNENKRPKNITIELYQNGQKIDSQKILGDLNSDWNFIFEDLPKYDENGKEYKYTLGEEKLDNYEISIDGTTITNTYKEKQATDTTSAKSNLPKSGIKYTILIPIIGIILVVAGVSIYRKKR